MYNQDDKTKEWLLLSIFKVQCTVSTLLLKADQ